MTMPKRFKTSKDVLASVLAEFPIGRELEPVTVVVTRDRVDSFGYVSTDRNPIHFDEIFAAKTPFKQCIAHGLLTGSFTSAIFGRYEGAIYREQSFRFLAPVHIGDTITSSAMVQGHGDSRGVVIFNTFARNQKGELVLTGEADIKFTHLLP